MKFLIVGFAIWTSLLLLWIAVEYYARSQELHLPWTTKEKLRNFVLIAIPIGSNIKDVTNGLKNHNWKVFYEQPLNNVQNDTIEDTYPGVKGIYAIGADLGDHYCFPGTYHDSAYFGFDKSKELVDIRAVVTRKYIF